MTDFTALEQALPAASGRGTVQQRLAAVEGALAQLLDTLRYALQNLGAENFNAAGRARLTGPLELRLQSAEGNLAALTQTVSDQGAAVSLVADAKGVRAAEIVAAINAAGSSVRLAADKIQLDGITTVADRLNIGGASDFGTAKYLVFHTSGAVISGWYSESPALRLSAARIELEGDVLLGGQSLQSALASLERRVAALEAAG